MHIWLRNQVTWFRITFNFTFKSRGFPEQIDWFWLRGRLNNKRAICTGTAPLFGNSISLFERPRTRLVRNIGSQNQSIAECHYGGGDFSRAKRLSSKCTRTQKRWISGFWLSSVGNSKRCNFSSRIIVRKHASKRLAVLICSWNLQENWWCELFWACGNTFGAKN